jgi:hypothetical protein
MLALPQRPSNASRMGGATLLKAHAFSMRLSICCCHVGQDIFVDGRPVVKGQVGMPKQSAYWASIPVSTEWFLGKPEVFRGVRGSVCLSVCLSSWSGSWASRRSFEVCGGSHQGASVCLFVCLHLSTSVCLPTQACSTSRWWSRPHTWQRCAITSPSCTARRTSMPCLRS